MRRLLSILNALLLMLVSRPALADVPGGLDPGQWGVSVEARRAGLLVGTMCAQGQGPACLALALLHGARTPIPMELTGTLSLAEEGCQGGEPAACAWEGRLLLQTSTAPELRARGSQRLLDACAAGFRPACVEGAAVVLGGVGGLDPRLGANAARDACAAGDPATCWLWGWAQARALGTMRRPTEAATTFAKACYSGYLVACTLVLDANPPEEPPARSQTAAQLARGCRGGDALMCTLRARLSEFGVIDVPSLSQARHFYTLGCDGGDALACARLGEMQLRAEGGPADTDHALASLALACDRGALEGCLHLTEARRARDPSSESSGALYVRACEAGLPEVCLRLAEAGPSEARGDGFRRACHLGSPEGCAGLARELSGPGAMAVRVMACDLGSLQTCRAMAQSWLSQPDRGDRLLGSQLLVRACQEGEPSACADLEAQLRAQREATGPASQLAPQNDLAVAYLGFAAIEGQGVSADPDLGGRLALEACAGGSPVVCTWVALLHLQGKGIEHDPPRAVALLTTACEAGVPDACALLASLYDLGLAVPRTPDRAKELFAKACALGDDRSCVGLGPLTRL